MRWLFAFLSLVLLTAAAPVRDWSATTTRLPSGAMLIGNPAAPVKLVEYGSYTCSHCAAFSIESDKTLKGDMIRRGKVSLEYRHLIRDQLDLGAAILARCSGTRGFASSSSAIFAAQSVWLKQAIDWAPKHPEVAGYPPLKQARAFVDGAGLTAMMVKRGLTPKQIAACFANQAEADTIVKLTADAPAAVTYTPTFYLNGAIVPGVDWTKLEPMLRAKING
jgi:protein-disulfide isomerase